MKTKISTLIVALSITGCATDPATEFSKIQDELNQIQERNEQLQATVNQSNYDLQKITALNKQLQASNITASTAANNMGSGGDLLPPNAKTGECYARVLTPATYQTETKDMLKSAAGSRIQIIPATYEYVTESVLVREASEVAELVPARYEWRTESVLVREAYENLTTIPEVYETQSEKILVKPAYTTWKKGRGPIERLNNSTGEIMCLVEIPAEYRTVTSRVIKTAASTSSTPIPAVYKDVKKRIMVEGPTMVKRTIPAEYKSVKVKKVATPARENRIEIPAVYQSVSNRVRVTDSILEWRSILCETNTTGDVVRNIQRALSAAGHNPGRVDGVIGSETMSAVKAYQREKNLAVGQFTIETLKSLGVNYRY